MKRREFITLLGGTAALPIVRPTQFQIYLNLKTAKALGVQTQPLLLALADDVIE